MKKYPKICSWDPEVMIGEPIVAFDKLDGTNIYATWDHRRGFYEFGTRDMIPEDNEFVLGEAITLIKDKYEEDLQEIFKKQGWDNVTCFFEFVGESSFAGMHVEDQEHEIVMIDVSAELEGLLPAGEFLDAFKDKVDIPKILFVGVCTKQFIDSVKDGLAPGMTFEGAVIKGFSENLYVKVKNKAWVEKLQKYCEGDNNLFRKMFYSS